MRSLKLLVVFLFSLSLIMSVSAVTGVAPGNVSCGYFATNDSLFVLTGDVGPCESGLTLDVNVILDCGGFRVFGDGNFSAFGAGVTLSDVATVKNCVISDFFSGVRSVGVGGVSVVNNTVFNVSNGVELSHSSGVDVSDNVIFDASQTGISSNVNFSDSLVSGNFISRVNGSGVFLGFGSSGNSMIGNFVNDSLRGFTLIQSSSGNLIQNNVVIGSGDVGVLVESGSSGNNVTGNLVIGSGSEGVAVQGGSANLVVGNNVSVNGVGVLVDNASGSVVQFNNIFNNSLVDLQVFPDSTGSVFSLNWWGVFPPVFSQFSGVVFPFDINPVLDGPYPGGVPVTISLPDVDGDGVFDSLDNCPLTFNPDQLDSDSVQTPEFRQFDGTDKSTCNGAGGFWCPDLNLTSVCVFDMTPVDSSFQPLVCGLAAFDGNASACDAAGFPVPGVDVSYLCDDKCVLDATPLDPSLVEQCFIDSDGFGDACDNCPLVQNPAVPFLVSSPVVSDVFAGGSGFNLSGGALLYYAYAPVGAFGNPFDVFGFVDGPSVSGFGVPVSGVSLEFARTDCVSAVDADFLSLDPVSDVSGAALWMPPVVFVPSVICVREAASPLSMWQLENFSSFGFSNVSVDVLRVGQLDSDGDGVGDACEVVCDDSDGDGFGVLETASCPAGPGIDCDDANASIFPGSLVESDPFSTDNVGLCQVQIEVCNGLTGSFDLNQSAIGPVPELCDALDNDCNSLVDNGFNVGVACVSAPNNCGDTAAGTIQCTLAGGSECNALTPANRPPAVAYVDSDSDGFGGLIKVNATCGVPVGAVGNNLDCDDTESVINPDSLGGAASEGDALLCDGIDNNCDGVVDDGCPVCVNENKDNKAHFKTTKGTPRTDDDSQNKNVLTVRGVGFDNYKGNSDDDLFVILKNGPDGIPGNLDDSTRLNVKTDNIPGDRLIVGIEIESTELVPLSSSIDKKNSIKVDHVLKGKDGDNLFAYSGSHFSLFNPFFSWIYTWDTATVDASGDPDYAGFASLNITTSDRFKVHVDLKPLECKEVTDEDLDDDGIPDVDDDDDDDDGILDSQDAHPKDHDNDGLNDLVDDDDDNDGKKDNKDKHKRNKHKK